MRVINQILRKKYLIVNIDLLKYYITCSIKNIIDTRYNFSFYMFIFVIDLVNIVNVVNVNN